MVFGMPMLFLDIMSGGIRRSSVFTSTNLFTSLYIIVNFAIFLRSSSDFQLRSSIMELTDDVLWWRLVTYLALFVVPFLACALLFWWYGSQTELAYSTVGLTSDLYAVSFILLLFMFKFHFRNPIVLLALLQMFLMCSFHFRSALIFGRFYSLKCMSM